MRARGAPPADHRDFGAREGAPLGVARPRDRVGRGRGRGRLGSATAAAARGRGRGRGRGRAHGVEHAARELGRARNGTPATACARCSSSVRAMGTRRQRQDLAMPRWNSGGNPHSANRDAISCVSSAPRVCVMRRGSASSDIVLARFADASSDIDPCRARVGECPLGPAEGRGVCVVLACLGCCCGRQAKSAAPARCPTFEINNAYGERFVAALRSSRSLTVRRRRRVLRRHPRRERLVPRRRIHPQEAYHLPPHLVVGHAPSKRSAPAPLANVGTSTPVCP